jgi:hypothetical protein
MAYAGIDRKRFAQMLEWGTDDDELRRFFADSRVHLIHKGAKVQNLPHGKAARVRVLTQGLPPPTDRLLQKWCAENLTMLDPEPVAKLVATLRMYEDVGESPPEDEAKRLARSCLVHLFAADPAPELMSFLKAPQKWSATDMLEAKDAPVFPVSGPSADALPAALGKALIALAEGKDPDKHLSSLSPTTASFMAGVHAVRSGRDGEVNVALEALASRPEARTVLAEYVSRNVAARARASSAPRGLQMLRFSEPDESASFDFDRDEVVAICTRDFPESAVFVRPFAVRAANGVWVSLARDGYREKLFASSGDLIAFSGGRDVPKQPKRGEIGIWKAAENRNSGPTHRTNFHIASEKTPVYEVRDVPFASTEYDSVREYIKHQIKVGEPTLARTSLFILRDELVVGCPPGKDMSRDEGFDTGLPCWRVLPAFRFEGRMLVPGPLPPSEMYECEALGSSLRKLFASGATGSDKPTKAQVRTLQELLASGELQLNAARAARLQTELGAIEEHDAAMDVLLDQVMRDPRIASRVDELVQARVEELVAKKEQLRKSVEQLERQKSELVESRRQAEKEQKAIAPTVAKAIRAAFDKARGDALGTLGQVAVFKALVDEMVERPAMSANTMPAAPARSVAIGSAITVRGADVSSAPVIETLRTLGVTPKCARAIESVGKLAHECGLVLVLDGLAARIAAESWAGGGAGNGKVLECGVGVTDDSLVRATIVEAPEALAVLDANLSPLDVYARPLIDIVQRRLSGTTVTGGITKILMSVSGSVAALPLPLVVESISLRVSLDRIPAFIEEDDVAARLEEIATSDKLVGWFARIWKPAGARVLNCLRSMPLDDAAFALSALEAAQLDPQA